jgi:hypothetical protein
MSYLPPHIGNSSTKKPRDRYHATRYGNRASPKSKYFQSRKNIEQYDDKAIFALLSQPVFCPNDDYRMIPGKWHAETNPHLFLYGYICGRCGFKFDPFHTEEGKIATHGLEVGTLDGALDANMYPRKMVTESIPLRTSKKFKQKTDYEKSGLDPMILRDVEVTTPPGDIIKSRVVAFRGKRFKI